MASNNNKNKDNGPAAINIIHTLITGKNSKGEDIRDISINSSEDFLNGSFDELYEYGYIPREKQKQLIEAET